MEVKTQGVRKVRKVEVGHQGEGVVDNEEGTLRHSAVSQGGDIVMWPLEDVQ